MPSDPTQGANIRMLDPKAIDDFTRKLAALMPASVTQFQGDIEKNLKAGLQGVLQKADLVTREEYEVQAALLARTRERLATLEARIQSLEEQLAGRSAAVAD
ncbi:MAG: accessory factor UbiK family protein [Thiotrichales bacterium]